MNFVHTFNNGTLAEANGDRRLALIKLSEAASRAGKSFTALSEALKLLEKSRLPRKLKKRLKNICPWENPATYYDEVIVRMESIKRKKKLKLWAST